MIVTIIYGIAILDIMTLFNMTMTTLAITNMI